MLTEEEKDFLRGDQWTQELQARMRTAARVNPFFLADGPVRRLPPLDDLKQSLVAAVRAACPTIQVNGGPAVALDPDLPLIVVIDRDTGEVRQLSQAEADRIMSTKMDPKYDHLDDLLEDDGEALVRAMDKLR